MDNPTPTPFEKFVAPARAEAALWRTLLGVVLIFVIYVGSLAVLISAVRNLLGPGYGQQQPISSLVLLASFAGVAVGVMLVTHRLHYRPIGTLFGAKQTVIRDFLITAFAAAVIYTLAGATLNCDSF